MLKFIFFMLVFIHLNLFMNFPWFFYIYLYGFFIIWFMFFRLFNYGYFLSSYIFLDKLSYWLIILSLMIFLVCYLSSGFTFYSSYFWLYIVNLNLLMFFMLTTFLVSNFFFFFFFFECTLIPTLYLILGWGMKVERISSGLYMFFYTMFGSFPLLIGLMKVYKIFGVFIFLSLDLWVNNFFYCFCFSLAFLVKLPMFLFHSWLPKAHVEAPVTGSMILAGILLKLGGYGLIRLISVSVSLSDFFKTFIFSLSFLGGLISGLICFRQIDLKSLVAYSSVSHMSMIICSLLSLNSLGFLGSLMLMISHGFCSSCLFFLVNLNYERVFSRSMILNKGFLSVLPSLGFWWFMFISLNMSCPPSLNLIGEILIFNSMFCWSFKSWFFLFFMPFISMIYSLNLYSFSQHGNLLNLICFIYPSNILEFMVIILHFLPLFFLFLNLLIFI